MFAKFSPDGSRVAYVRANNIYVERLDDGKVTQLTQRRIRDDHQRHVRLGVRGGARRPRRLPLEPGRPRASRYWQFDTTGVGVFSLINDTDALYPDRHADPVSEGRHDQLRRAHRRGRRRRRRDALDEDAGRSARQLPRARWSGSTPDTVAIQQLNRLQNRNDFLLADARSGRRHARVPRRVDDVGRSRRRGPLDRRRPRVSVDQRARRLAARLPRAARRRQTATLITRFDADVIDVVGVDETGGWLYFLASPANATQRYLYRVEARRIGRARARDARRSAGHARLRRRAGRPLGVPHLVADSIGRRSTDVVDLPDHDACARSTDHVGARGEARRDPEAADRVLHASTSATASRSTAG